MKSKEHPVLFLDRDGTVNEEVNYLSDPANLRVLPGAAEAIRRFNEAGWAVVLVTNQAGVGRGYFTLETVEAIHRKLADELAAHGAHLDGVYVCPHHPDEGCDCRKPETALFRRALHDLGLTASRCVVVGDNRTDLEAGRALGCETILVETGYGAELAAHPEALPFRPDAILPNLPAVADYVLNDSRAQTSEADSQFTDSSCAY